MVDVKKIMTTSFKSFHACTASLSAPDSAAGHHQPTPLPETPEHSWTSLGQSLVGSLLLSPGSWCAYVLCVPSKSLFPQCCVSSGGSMVRLMVTSSKRPYAIPRSTAPRVSAPAADHSWPIPPQETLKQSWLSLCGVSGSWRTQGLFEPFEHLWQGWGLIINAPPTILLGLLLCPWKWCIFLGGIQHSPVDGCSAASCNFEALTGDEHTSFYSAILCGMLSGFHGSSMDENFIPTSRVIQLIGPLSLWQYPSAITGHVFQLVSPPAQMLSRRIFIDTVQKIVSLSARSVTWKERCGLRHRLHTVGTQGPSQVDT